MNQIDVLSHIRPDAGIGFLQDIVRIPSENPPGNERAVVEFITERLRGLGFETEHVTKAPGRPNLVATRRGSGGGPTLVFNGHIDTKPAIPPAGSVERWTRDPFGGEIVDGKLYGCGAVDMKGGVAAAIMAAEALVRSSLPCRGDLIIQAVCDEEQGSAYGTRAVIEHGVRGDFAIVPEPTELELSVAQMGALWVELHTYGERAHASTAWQRVNAIDKMTKVIDAVWRAAERRKALSHRLFPHHPITNLGIIEGGQHPGTVASFCRLAVDFRLIPGESQQSCLDILTEELNAAMEADPQLRVTSQLYAGGGAEPNEIAEDAPVVSALAEASEALRGVRPGILGWAAFADAALLRNRGGIPTVVFGPGSIAQAHAVDEFVPVDQVLDCTRIFALAMADLLNRDRPV